MLNFHWIKAGTSKGLSYIFLYVSSQIFDVRYLNKSSINNHMGEASAFLYWSFVQKWMFSSGSIR